MSSNSFSVLQPHEGPSETHLLGTVQRRRERFNPTRVRLKLRAPSSPHCRPTRFNPTRVRLKRDTSARTPHRDLLQPHEGPSETRRLGRKRVRGGRFNPTRVRLKLWWQWNRKQRAVCFNPTRVRLKPSIGIPNNQTLESFNPTRVRLKPQLRYKPCVPMGASTPRGSV